ncbi:hypothetical protein HETIRDRAFT_9532, partial [Heterobasidion irregulare TC 32-1]
TSLASTVSVFFPLDEQLPLISRVNSPYSWSFSPLTFSSSSNASLVYNASSLPNWMSFDSSARTFEGTPRPDDEGSPNVKITAIDPDSSDSASSSFTLCVTPDPAPTLNTSVADQFYHANPSLSSVFLLSPNSALNTGNPMLRIPPKWSFSIGFNWDTFVGPRNVYYSVLQKDGSPLPDWMVFHPKSITLNGVVPSTQDLPTPHTLSFALHAAEQEGYSAASLPFDVVIAEHEVSLSGASLPTINITSVTPFDVAFSSPDDFVGILLDGEPVELADISSLSVETSKYSNWLRYDEGSRKLAGTPPKELDGQVGPVLPVTLKTTYNQTVYTNVSLAVVPSYFSEQAFDPILVDEGGDVRFNLISYFSNRTGVGGHDDVNLTASFDPDEAGSYLVFDSTVAQLSGVVPLGSVDYSHITVTFTAYSRITHSTSHSSLPISLTPSDFKHTKPADPRTAHLSSAARKRLLLGLGIAFGVIGGTLVLGLILAAFRRCARVKDTALVGEEGSRGWTEKERQWYGIGDARVDAEKGYGWSNMHTGSQESQDSIVSKGEFLGKLRSTVRQVSDKYRRQKKPVIGKPLLLLSSEEGRMRMMGLTGPSTPILNPLAPVNGADYSATGTASSLHGSVNSSTGDRSIPKRRADFGPPTTPSMPGAVHVRISRQPGRHEARLSIDSAASLADSLSSNSSTRTHAIEAVIQTASRALSVRSMKSTSGMSYHSTPDDTAAGSAKARLVPFTNASRVPVPDLPASLVAGRADERSDGVAVGGRSKRRVTSQIANISNAPPRGQGPDELSVGMQYVRALGEDKEAGTLRIHSASDSFSSLESSHRARSSLGSGMSAGMRQQNERQRILIRAGERFRFRVHIMSAATESQSAKPRTYVARQISGQPLPEFVNADFDAREGRRKDTVKFWGIPRREDVGEVSIGVFGDDGECVGSAVVEVI